MFKHICSSEILSPHFANFCGGGENMPLSISPYLYMVGGEDDSVVREGFNKKNKKDFMDFSITAQEVLIFGSYVVADLMFGLISFFFIRKYVIFSFWSFQYLKAQG